MDVFCYMVYDEETGEGILIDPAGNEDQLLDLLRQKNVKLRYIVNTHGHADHTCGNDYLKEATGAPVVMHSLDDDFFQRADIKGWTKMMGLDTPAAADVRVEDGDELSFGNIVMKFLHTPGHSPGACCILIDGNLFTGDTLFVGAVGRTDFPGCSFRQMKESFETKLLKLPPDTVVWPGHDYGDRPYSTIGHEAQTNPYIMDFVAKS